MTYPSQAATTIHNRAPGFKPKIGIILGSGLGSFANEIQNPIIIPYPELRGFPISTVPGHAGRLVLGYLNGLPIACLQGRVHAYEGATAEDFKVFIRTLKLIGCEVLLITNASGSLRVDVKPGELMLINDHIILSPRNPLLGPNDEEFGPRFFPMDDAYDPALRKRFQQVAQQINIKLAEGVYCGVLGPNYETPAEIRAFRTLGGDAVGMSTVPEVLVARHCGLRVAVIAAISNFAAGMSDEELTHENVLITGKQAAQDLSRLLLAFLQNWQQQPC
jgi:xanthosine phosphorylase